MIGNLKGVRSRTTVDRVFGHLHAVVQNDEVISAIGEDIQVTGELRRLSHRV